MRDDCPDLELPEFLRVENRVPLTPDQEARVAEIFTDAARNAVGQKPADVLIIEKMREEQRQAKITAMKNRFARAKAPKANHPTGSTWDTRTSRWVMPGDGHKTPQQLIAGASTAAGPTTRQIMSTLRKERRMSDKPNFSSMSGDQLLEAYNSLSTTKRKAKFSDKKQGVAACEREWTAKQTKVPTEADIAAAKAKMADPAKNKRAAKEPAAPKNAKADAAEKAGKELTKVAKAPEEGTRAKRLQMKIKIITEKNPRREGTDAHRHYEAMRGGIMVGQYLDKFKPEDKRTAAQWLSNTVRDSHVEIVEK